MKINKNVEKSIEYIKQLNDNSSDIVDRTINIKKCNARRWLECTG